MLEAVPTDFLSRNFRLELESKLVGQSWTTREFGLFDGDQQIGGIYPRGIFTRRAKIDLPGDWPLAN